MRYITRRRRRLNNGTSNHHKDGNSDQIQNPNSGKVQLQQRKLESGSLPHLREVQKGSQVKEGCGLL